MLHYFIHLQHLAMKLIILIFASVSTFALAEGPLVTVDTGALEGTAENGVHAFKGIPYAAPPVGGLRWRAPQAPPKWDGVRKAVRYGSDAPQRLSLTQDEDCLFLNVWAPADVARRPYPVMAWIHGGGLNVGSGKCAGENFAKKGVVLVSFNYRLGRLGAFAHPALLAARPKGEPPGNFWLLDQIAALEWAQRNIGKFGGDPKRVTIFGVSSGGTSVNMLMMSPNAKGLFNGAIAQSGIGGFGPFRRISAAVGDRPSQATLGQRWAEKKNATTSEKLRALPWREVVADSGEGESGVEPVVDEVTIPDDPQRVFAAGRQHRIPLIAGANSFEGTLARVFPWGEQPPKPAIQANLTRLAPLYGKPAADPSLMLDLYGDVFFRSSAHWLANQMQRVETPAWNYHFDYVRKSERKKSKGAGHGSEVPYVFGSVILPALEDLAAIHVVQGHWIQFAKTGNPNGPGLPDWPATTTAAPVTMVYGNETTKAVPELDKARFGILYECYAQSWPDMPTLVEKPTLKP